MQKLLRIDAVIETAAIKKSSIYERIQKGTFPQPIKIGHASAWLESEVQEWVLQRISESRRAA